jgi:hypothetical protein
MLPISRGLTTPNEDWTLLLLVADLFPYDLVSPLALFCKGGAGHPLAKRVLAMLKD